MRVASWLPGPALPEDDPGVCSGQRGLVRGFAVTPGAGIVTTLFTAFSLTRLIIAWRVWEFRPRRVPI